MKARWKLLGLAGVAGVAATGVIVARKNRIQSEYTPDEIRERLRRRVAEVTRHGDGATPHENQPPDPRAT